MACAADTTERSFVCGDDSDFLVFRGCRYIKFGEWLTPRDAHAPGQAVPLVVVWRADIIADELLGLTFSGMVDLACLLGKPQLSNRTFQLMSQERHCIV